MSAPRGRVAVEGERRRQVQHLASTPGYPDDAFRALDLEEVVLRVVPTPKRHSLGVTEDHETLPTPKLPGDCGRTTVVYWPLRIQGPIFGAGRWHSSTPSASPMALTTSNRALRQRPVVSAWRQTADLGYMLGERFSHDAAQGVRNGAVALLASFAQCSSPRTWNRVNMRVRRHTGKRRGSNGKWERS